MSSAVSYCTIHKCRLILHGLLVIFQLHMYLCSETSAFNLLIISLDGFRWDYINNPNLTIPNFKKIMTDGVHSKKGMKNIFPTVTFPNHYTLVTGLYAESHGLVGNRFFDPWLNDTFDMFSMPENYCNGKWYHGEPIWVTNQRQNPKHLSGSYFWPGSCAYIKGMLPYQTVSPYNMSVPYRDRIDTIIEWFTAEFPINLGLLYFEEPDYTGHEHGPDSDYINPVIESIDSDLGYLLKKMEERNLLKHTNIIVTSDHGMAKTPTDVKYKIDLDNYLDSKKYNSSDIDLCAFLWPRDKESEDEIMQNLTGKVPHLTPYRKEDFPDEFHYKRNHRISPIILMADEHYWVSGEENSDLGGHGYSNAVKSMHPIFMAVGPSFKSGATVEIFNSVDIYPLMCHLLGLKPAPNNGSIESIMGLLKTPEQDTITFGTYIFLLLALALVGGIYSVAACQVHHIYKRSRVLESLRTVTLPNDETKTGLMSDLSVDDEI